MEDQENSSGGTERIKDDFVECEAEYRLLEYLGSGAYGTVCSAQNLSTLEKIAIKKCKNVFKSRTIAKRTLREIRILRHLSHPNIIQLKGLLPTSDPTNNDIFLLFELMDTDLSQIIRSPQDLCVDHVQYFMYQLFSAVAYLHEGNVVHRDIK
jgi:serine/threonine protein kinase